MIKLLLENQLQENKKIKIDVIDIVRLKDGKYLEHQGLILYKL